MVCNKSLFLAIIPSSVPQFSTPPASPIISTISPSSQQTPTSIKSSITTSSTTISSDSNKYSNGIIIAGIYKLEKTIGKGSYGKVKLASNIYTKEKLAIKFIAKSSIKKPSHLIRIRREINLLKLLHHPHIVRLVDHFETDSDILLILEYVCGADLFERITHHKEQRFNEREARHIFRQLVSALDYCHQNRIIHRDLKPENIMVDENNHIRVIDFGFANLYHPRGYLETNCGSPLYASPEIVQGARYIGPEVDIWSMGVILYAMLSGTLPFEDEQLKGLYAKICAGQFTTPSFLSASSKDLLRSILCTDSRCRATMEQVKHHSWLSGGGLEIGIPDNYLPFRAIVSSIDEKLVDSIVLDYGFGEDKTSVLNQIQHQSDSPAHAIYRLLIEREHRNQIIKDWITIDMTCTQSKKEKDDSIITPPITPIKSINNDKNLFDNANIPIATLPSSSTPASPTTGDTKSAGTIMAQAAAHVVNRIRKIKELNFNSKTPEEDGANNNSSCTPILF